MTHRSPQILLSRLGTGPLRLRVCQFLVLSLLCFSLDAGADAVRHGHPIGDDPLHQSRVMDLDRSSYQDTAVDDNEQSCERCCHAHSSVMLPTAWSQLPTLSLDSPGSIRATWIPDWRKPPPTPPPIY